MVNAVGTVDKLMKLDVGEFDRFNYYQNADTTGEINSTWSTLRFMLQIETKIIIRLIVNQVNAGFAVEIRLFIYAVEANRTRNNLSCYDMLLQ